MPILVVSDSAGAGRVAASARGQELTFGGRTMKDFAGKIAFIVGGSSGIGLSTARLLAEEGAHVLLLARERGRLERAAEILGSARKDPGQKVSWMQLDVSDREKVNAVLARAVEDFGVPDLLVNCAGRAYPRYFEEISYEQFDETMRTNFFGVWHTTSALVPYMKEKGGCIVNVSSMGGLIGVFGYTDYSASKFAIVGFSEALRSELKRYGIHVCVLCPPDTDTPAFPIENRTKPEETKALSKTARLMTPDDVAAALLKGIRQGRFLILANLESRLVWLARRLFPSLLDSAMDREIRRVQRKKGSGKPT